MRAGEGGLSPALIVASGKDGDYAFLSLKQSAFDLTDRGVAGRDAPQGLDAFVFTERGVYRTGETVYVTALLRDAAGIAVPDVDLTMVVERPDGVEYRRSVVPDQGIGGRSLAVPIIASAPTGTWRVAVYADPKGAAVGDASFLVEDYVPDRLEFDLTTKATAISPDAPVEVALDGRFLYGAPAAGLGIEGEVTIAKAAERPGYPGYSFGLDPSERGDEEGDAGSESIPLADLPVTDADGKAIFAVALGKLPASTKPLEANVVVRLAEPGGRAIERKLTLPVTPEAPMIGVKPLFTGKSLNDNDIAKFDVVMVATDGKPMAATGLKWQLLNVESKYQWYRSNGYWNYEPIKVTRRVADGTLDLTAGEPGKISVPVTWGRYRLEVASPDPQGPETTIGFDSGWYAEASADTPDLLEIALDKPEYKPGDTMTVAVTARSAGKVTLSVIGDRLITQTTADVEPGLVKLPLTVGQDWGTGAYVLATIRRPLDEAEKRMPGRAIGVQWFSVDRRAHTIGVALDLPEKIRPETALRVPVKLAGLAAGEDASHRRLSRRCRHSQPHQLQGARARRILSRAAQAVGRDPRPLRPADRRHARHEGRNQNRRRWRRRGTAREPAEPSPARLLFRHRQRRARRHGRSQLRYSRLLRHGARDGGRVECGQDRACLGRRHRARSGRGHRHAAALSPERR